MTKIGEIRVPGQKKAGGSHFVYNKATIHGNSPRLRSSPRIMSPVEIFDSPQVPTFLRKRLVVANVHTVTAYRQITKNIFLIMTTIKMLRGQRGFCLTNVLIA